MKLLQLISKATIVLRCALVLTGLGAVTAMAVATAAEIARQPSLAFDTGLTALCAIALALCSGWMLLVTTLAVTEQVLGAGIRVRMPAAHRRLALSLCGVAMAAPLVGGVAHADTAPAVPDRSALAGLPFPDRATDSDHPAQTSTGGSGSTPAEPGPTSAPIPAPTPTPTPASGASASEQQTSDSAAGTARSPAPGHQPTPAHAARESTKTANDGVTTAPPSTPASPPPSPSQHVAGSQSTRAISARVVVVRPGDSLWSITARLLPAGASNEAIDAGWRAIHQTNRGVIGDDPHVIHPGQRLTIGEELLSSRQEKP